MERGHISERSVFCSLSIFWPLYRSLARPRLSAAILVWNENSIRRDPVEGQPSQHTIMAMRMALQTIYDLFGPDSPSTPIFGNNATLNLLAQHIATGLSIANTTSKTGNSESSHAIEIATSRLQLAGRMPMDLETLRGLSEQQREALGFEPMTLDPDDSMQYFGTPPFKELDIAQLLAALRFAARCQQLKSGFKPVFQVGIVTMTVNGYEQVFFAQSLQAENGEVTDTIWLYRWVIMGLDGEYEEHWRPFDGPVTAQAFVPMGNVPMPAIQQQLQPPHQPSQTSPPTYQQQQQTQPPTSPPPPPVPKPRKHRQQHYETFAHTHLTDDELFSSPPEMIQGEAIMRLAESYSNGEIFSRLSAAHPGKIRNVNVITKRLTHAIESAARAEGVPAAEVRARIRAAKEAKGVAHKAKRDVTPYG